MDPLVKFVIVIHLLLSSHSSQTRSVANQGNHFIVYLFFSFLSGFFSICSFVLSQYPPSLTFICVPVWFMPCRFICCVQDVALMFLFPPHLDTVVVFLLPPDHTDCTDNLPDDCGFFWPQSRSSTKCDTWTCIFPALEEKGKRGYPKGYLRRSTSLSGRP